MAASEFQIVLDHLQSAVSVGYDLPRLQTYIETLLSRRPAEFVAEHGTVLRQYAQWYHHCRTTLGRAPYFWNAAMLVEATPALAAALPPAIAALEAKQDAAARAIREAEEAEWLAECDRRAEEHRQERLARGLGAQASTGKAERAVFLREPAKEKNAGTDRLPLGASRFGGVPDLPASIPWPVHQGKKLIFLAQINLTELPAGISQLLPQDGWLIVFGLLNDDVAQHPYPMQVFLHRGRASDLGRCAQPADDEIWQDWGDMSSYDAVPLTVVQDDVNDDCDGWLLGEMADWTGETPGAIADAAFLEGDDWINLLAIKSVGSMQWSDCGHLYLLARRNNLERGDLSGVIATILST